MSRAAALLAELVRQGFAVRVVGDMLEIKPVGNLPPALLAAIRSEKAALLRVLTEPEEGTEANAPDDLPEPDPPFFDGDTEEEIQEYPPLNLTDDVNCEAVKASFVFIARWNAGLEAKAADRAERRPKGIP